MPVNGFERSSSRYQQAKTGQLQQPWLLQACCSYPAAVVAAAGFALTLAQATTAGQQLDYSRSTKLLKRELGCLKLN